MVSGMRRFGEFRHRERIKRNRQRVRILDRDGTVLCSVNDAWNEATANAESGGGTLNDRGASLTWYLPRINIPQHVVIQNGQRIVTDSNETWNIQRFDLTSADSTYACQSTFMPTSRDIPRP